MLETVMARTMRHLAVPGSDRSMKNPVPLSQDILAAGRAHFADHCAICHGNDGKGQTEIGQNLYPKAPDMTAAATQSLSDGEIFSIIKNGVRLTGMPAWGGDTPEDDTASWHLVHFIRHLPKITGDELEEMESLNPRSPDELREEEEEGKFLEGKPATEPHKHHH
jgi:mono/diheme cytochrome c family protein